MSGQHYHWIVCVCVATMLNILGPGQVAYIVDMAKADALDLLGETRQAFELVDRHV